MELHPSSACLPPEISFPKPASHRPEGLLGPGSGFSQMPPNQQAARSRWPGYKVVLSDHHPSAKFSFITLEEGRTAGALPEGRPTVCPAGHAGPGMPGNNGKHPPAFLLLVLALEMSLISSIPNPCLVMLWNSSGPSYGRGQS